MKIKFIKAAILAVLSLTLLVSCGENDKEDVTENENNNVKAAFNEAYAVATFFSGYAGNVCSDESITLEIDNAYYSEVQYDRFIPCGTMEELDALILKYFSSEISDAFDDVEPVANAELFIEKDGVLYRFGGYSSLYPVDTENIEVTSVTKNADTFTVSVKAEYPDFYGEELATVTHDYTCKYEDGNYIFIGEFPLLADIAIDEMLDDKMLLPLG